MEKDAIEKQVRTLQSKLFSLCFEPKPYKVWSIVPSRIDAINHAQYLLTCIYPLLKEDKLVEAAQLLGMVQGILWTKEIPGVRASEEAIARG